MKRDAAIKEARIGALLKGGSWYVTRRRDSYNYLPAYLYDSKKHGKIADIFTPESVRRTVPPSPVQNDCNGSGPHTAGEVRVMPVGGEGNDILCRSCWSQALAYRQTRNRELGNAFQFSLPAWETAKVYRGDE